MNTKTITIKFAIVLAMLTFGTMATAQTPFPSGIRLVNVPNDTTSDSIPVISAAGKMYGYITKAQLAAQLSPPLTLQDVTDNGSTTTNQITATAFEGDRLELVPQGLTDPSPTNWSVEGIDSTLVMTPPTGGSYSPAALDFAKLTEERAYSLPDKPGTIALLDDVPAEGVQSVTGGTNITVDNTDPANPEVSAPNMVTTNTSQTITAHKTFSDGVSGMFANFGPFANALSLSGDDTGDANRVVINFLDQFDSFQGSLGFNSATDSDFTWENDEGGNSLTLLESGGANGLQYDYSGGPGTVYHSGNLNLGTLGGVPTSRTLTAGTGLTGGGDLSANRSFSLDTGYTDGRYVNTTGDTMTGSLQFNTFSGWQLGTGSPTIRTFSNGTNNFFDLFSGNLIIRDDTSLRWTFERTTGNFTATGTITGSNLSGTNTGDQTLSGLGGVPTSRTLTAGDGLSGGGDLSANRTFAVDGTVVRTSGTQSIGGAKTFTSAVNVPDQAYGSGWNGSTAVPTRNAIYDKLETMAVLRTVPSSSIGAVQYNGNGRSPGNFYGSTADPTNTTARLNYDGPFHAYAITAANIMTATNFVLSSDRRLKENIKDLEPRTMPIRWRTFKWKDTGEDQTGVVAQEVEKYAPEMVVKKEDGTLGVKYIDLLIAKVAELEARIIELENERK